MSDKVVQLFPARYMPRVHHSTSSPNMSTQIFEWPAGSSVTIVSEEGRDLTAMEAVTLLERTKHHILDMLNKKT